MPSPGPSVAASSAAGVDLRKGSLADFKADVLVNLITCQTPNLAKAGAVSSSLLSIAGTQLQTEFEGQSSPATYGTDVAVTSACDLQAKHIFHAAVRKYKDSTSNKLLYDMISRCISMAVDKKMMSIAFPTVGCGKLGYDPAAVANCFLRAQNDALIKVYVVAYEDDVFESLKTNLLRPLPAALHREPVPVAAKKTGQALKRKPSSTIVFEISAMDRPTVEKVMTALRTKADEMVCVVPVSYKGLEELSKEAEDGLKKLQSSDVTVEIDHKTKSIKLQGKRQHIHDKKKKVKQILKKDKQYVCSPEYVKKTKSVHEYLLYLGDLKETRYPSYWTPGGVQGEAQLKEELKAGDSLYKEVEKMVLDTWEASKTGHGNDAAGLQHKQLVVKKIFLIQNRNQFLMYDAMRKKVCMQAGANQSPFPSLKGLRGEWEVKTRTLGLPELDRNLLGEINEYYLLHGTKTDLADNIVHEGADFRMAVSNSMFGRGVYYAESSTKADQYTDAKSQRVAAGQTLNMFVARAVLGNAFVCRKPTQFKKPPCTGHDCHTDTCTELSHQPFFHSVVGTHKSDTVRLIFREFVVYDIHQSYPEFLVEYERQ